MLFNLYLIDVLSRSTHEIVKSHLALFVVFAILLFYASPPVMLKLDVLKTSIKGSVNKNERI